MTETSTKCTLERAVTPIKTGNAPVPHPRRFKLNSLRGIRREMASVYRLARTGDMELADACKYAYILTTLGKLSEAELLEDRLSRLEQCVERKR